MQFLHVSDHMLVLYETNGISVSLLVDHVYALWGDRGHRTCGPSTLWIWFSHSSPNVLDKWEQGPRLSYLLLSLEAVFPL